MRRAERVVVAVEVEAGHPAQRGAGFELRVGLAGKHLHVVAERGKLAAEVTEVDPLAAAVRFTAVRKQRDPQRAGHGGQASRSAYALDLISARLRAAGR